MPAKWTEKTEASGLKEPESVVEMAEAEIPEMPKPKRGRKAVPKEPEVPLCKYCTEVSGKPVKITPDPKGIHTCQCRREQLNPED